MRHLLILAAAAFLAVGCAGRNEDETGAAPDRGNATVTATDSASVKTDSTMGQVPESTTPDSSAATSDTTSMGVPSDTKATPGDSALVNHAAPAADSTGAMSDSTSMDAPADTTAKQ